MHLESVVSKNRSQYQMSVDAYILQRIDSSGRLLDLATNHLRDEL